MKVAGNCEAKILTEKRLLLLRPIPGDFLFFQKFFESKEKKEARDNQTYCIEVKLDLPAKERTYKQNDTMWKLIEIIFQSQNGRKPDKDEKYDLYLDILDAYADRKVNKLTGKLRAIHISESDVYQAAQLIQACLDIIVDMCDLSTDLQADVKQIVSRWHTWRGTLERDPLDYVDPEYARTINEKYWRERHPVSEASGKPGVQLCHIISRGAGGAEEPWNWMALTVEEHNYQHAKGWDAFLKMYPHLKGKVERAKILVRG